MCVVLVCVLAGRPLEAGQVGRGALTGDVRDQAGASVPGATVTVTAVSTNAVRTATTGPDGRYSFPGLAAGTYDVAGTLTAAGIAKSWDTDGSADWQVTVTVASGTARADLAAAGAARRVNQAEARTDGRARTS